LESGWRASGRKLAMSGWFSAISFQKQRNSIFIGFTSGRLDQASGRSSLKSFPRSNGTLEYSKILDIVQRCYHIVRTACRDFPYLCLRQKPYYLSNTEWRQDGIAMSSGRYCRVVWTDALEHWILLKLLIAAGRFAITSGQMKS